MQTSAPRYAETLDVQTAQQLSIHRRNPRQKTKFEGFKEKRTNKTAQKIYKNKEKTEK